MSNVKLKTLTAIHVGSGNILQEGCDFVCGKDADGERIVGVISPRKVLSLIGEDKIDAWTVAIENGRSTDDVVRQYSPRTNISDYSLRIINSYMGKNPQQVKEYIHDSIGRIYVPGSSIKGAIRTAVLSCLAGKMDENSLSSQIRDRNGKVSAEEMEASLFGKGAQNDIFRFLTVGDAYFANNETALYNMVNINERTEKGFWDMSKPMATEVVELDSEATFRLSLNKKYNELVSSKESGVMPLPKEMASLKALFSTVNEHTLKLLQEEISIWEEKDVDTESEEKVEDYIQQISQLSAIAEKCRNTSSCVMRIGHGSGWRFITGAWTENANDVSWNSIVNAARPKNAERYSEYDFPKSRRLDEDNCEPLGFVKLTLCD